MNDYISDGEGLSVAERFLPHKLASASSWSSASPPIGAPLSVAGRSLPVAPQSRKSFTRFSCAAPSGVMFERARCRRAEMTVAYFLFVLDGRVERESKEKRKIVLPLEGTGFKKFAFEVSRARNARAWGGFMQVMRLCLRLTAPPYRIIFFLPFATRAAYGSRRAGIIGTFCRCRGCTAPS